MNTNVGINLFDYAKGYSLGYIFFKENYIEIVTAIGSDNIHVNAFMYEPLIDTTIDDLIVLYNEIKLVS